MQLPNHRKLGVLLTLAVLLSAITMGCLGPCEAFIVGIVIQNGGTITINVHAGESASDISPIGFLGIFSICESSVVAEGGTTTALPVGVYSRTRRDLTGSEPTATVDCVTTSQTPPGHYILEYRETSPTGQVRGTLDLTVEASQSNVTACLYALGEVYNVNHEIEFYACCSLAPPDDPIVQYKWWYDYNSNPSQPPSATTSACITYHTYTSAGAKYIRLVVRTQSGLTAEESHIIVVNAP